MKRNVSTLLLCICLLLSLALPAAASESALPLVIDSADLLTLNQEVLLETSAASLGDTYGMDVVILTVDSLGGKSPQDYADDYYDENGYGDDGMLFLISMEERDWYISTCGSAIYAVTDYGIQQLGALAVPYLSGGDYYGAFAAYLDALPSYFDAYQRGTPVDGYADDSGGYYHGDRETVVHYNNAPQRRVNIMISLIIGVIAALVAVLIMRGTMNTKRPQRSAGAYIRPGSYHLLAHRDMFLYSNIRKVRRQENNGGGGGHHGGGSSVHHSSGGRSHSGGGGKF